MIRHLPRRPSPNPPNRRPTNPKRPGMRSMICSLACVATATTTRKPSPSRSPRPSRKPSPRPTRTRRCSTSRECRTRALKKVLVEEQSTLLDGVRRSGSDAIAVVVADADAHAARTSRRSTQRSTRSSRRWVAMPAPDRRGTNSCVPLRLIRCAADCLRSLNTPTMPMSFPTRCGAVPRVSIASFADSGRRGGVSGDRSGRRVNRERPGAMGRRAANLCGPECVVR